MKREKQMTTILKVVTSGELSDFEGSEAVDVFVFLSCNYLFINQYDCSYIGS